MFKCIICLESFSDEEKSLEHIFPDAIGGQLTIDTLCSPCNKKLGSGPDAALVNQYFVQAKRMVNQIKGKNGYVPNILENGVFADDPSQKVKYIIEDGKPVKLHHITSVKREKHGSGENVHIRVDASEEHKIAEIIEKIMKRASVGGKAPVPKHLYREEIREERPLIQISAEIDTFKYIQGMLKIIYEIAYLFLGEVYLTDSIAGKLRMALTVESFSKDFLESLDLRGTYRMGPEIGPIRYHPNYHYASIHSYADLGIAVSVRIFDAFEALIRVSENTCNLPPGAMTFIALDPLERTYCSYDLLGFMDHLSKINPPP